MTLRATITNENTSDLAPLYTTTFLIFGGVEVQGRPSPHPQTPSPFMGDILPKRKAPSPFMGEGVWG